MKSPLPSQEWPNDINDPVYFINGQWAVTGYGLERTTDGKPYEWDKDRLLATHDHGDGFVGCGVLEHIGEKTWVDGDALIEAFRVALEVHFPGAELPFDLAQAEAELRAYKAGDR